MSIITLTTDFGERDWFVGAMKGVILSIAPSATIVDITHEIPPGDIRQAAYALASAHRYFPPSTVHLAVVDPGVGTDRLPIAARTKAGIYVAPDNGLLSLVLEAGPSLRVRRVTNRKLTLTDRSRTFHGRDVFAPLAAHLANGVRFSKAGPKLEKWNRLAPVRLTIEDGRITGEIVYIDRFGNALTNIPAREIEKLSQGTAPEIRIGKRRIAGVSASYEDIPKGRLGAVISSNETLEMAIKRGSAAEAAGLRAGMPVTASAASVQP